MVTKAVDYSIRLNGRSIPSKTCGCGKGYRSEFDHQCKFCREIKYERIYTREVLKNYVKRRGDGLNLDDAQTIREKY